MEYICILSTSLLGEKPTPRFIKTFEREEKTRGFVISLNILENLIRNRRRKLIPKKGVRGNSLGKPKGRIRLLEFKFCKTCSKNQNEMVFDYFLKFYLLQVPISLPPPRQVIDI